MATFLPHLVDIALVFVLSAGIIGGTYVFQSKESHRVLSTIRYDET